MVMIEKTIIFCCLIRVKCLEKRSILFSQKQKQVKLKNFKLN